MASHGYGNPHIPPDQGHRIHPCNGVVTQSFRAFHGIVTQQQLGHLGKALNGGNERWIAMDTPLVNQQFAIEHGPFIVDLVDGSYEKW